jgi:hypothetical protein
MRVGILHLSDIHLTKNSNPILSRLPRIVAALRSALIGVKNCFVAITGDIAASGTPAEYEAAERFLDKLFRWMREELGLTNLNVVMVPGNHDCNFLDCSELRDVVLQSLDEHLHTLDASGEFVAKCLSAQTHFFWFEAKVNQRNAPLPTASQLHYRRVFTLDDCVIRFECFNTAWLSRRDEGPGTLHFPITSITAYDPNSPCDLVVSLFHHPYPWLETINRHEFQRYIERTSDVVLTGHEHLSECYRKETRSGDLIQYVEGARLQGTDVLESGFNVALIDLDNRQQTLLTYEWKVDGYDRVNETGPRAFIRNQELVRGAFENDAAFLYKLTDPGRGFNHPFKKSLRLADIFVYPDVWQRSLEKLLTDVEQPQIHIRGENLLPYVASKRFILFTGEKDAGKSSLAKTLYTDLQRLHGLVPLMMSGEEVESIGQFPHDIDRAICKQYGPTRLEAYRQLPLDKRTLILDDFHRVPLNRKAQRQLMAVAREHFGTIIVFGEDLFAFQELAAEEPDGVNALCGFDHCELRPFGHVLRHRLIGRWVTLGREHLLGEKDIAHETTTKENIVNALIGKNVIPPLPVLILIILQAAEAARGPNIVSGAYGYFYEVLITEALSSVSSDITDTGAKYTYLSRLAEYMFSHGRDLVTDREMHDITEAYANEYRAPVHHATLLDQLVQCKILQTINGEIGFRYRYYYFYFVARHFKNAIADPAQAAVAREQLVDLADHVFFETYANILVFYLYLTMDIELIQRMLGAARAIFAEYRPCDLESGMDYVNDLFFAPPKRELKTAGGEATREEYLSRLDEEPDALPEQKINPQEVTYHSGLEISLKLNIAFKMLHLLGQILKNFPGSLKGQLKLEIALECYHLGLRALRACFELSREHFDDIKAFIEAALRERLRLNPEESRLPSAERVMLGLFLAATFGVIKRVSYAVGHEQLKLTYDDVMGVESGRLATSMIDLSIKLDYFPKDIPRAEIVDIERRVRGNHFCHVVLQDLVYQFLYLFPTTFWERQKLGHLVGIKVSDPRLYEERTKKLLG